MKKISLLYLMLLFATFAAAQTANVRGTIYDSINKKNLTNTVISLLRQKDSVLYKFSRSDAAGKFALKNIQNGKYVLLVTHPSYADYADSIAVNDAADVDLGTVNMTLIAHILEEVIVKQKISAITFKGDTTEFKADSFKVRDGGSVEELLKKLPGLQVDKDGKITAMGEKVNKVLVDGDEFFGDDPTIATRNLQAADVDKVQVYDKKSDQATFTGIDDGQREKTINLKLKEDRKKGYFGKIDLAAGLHDRWSNSLMLNAFKGKRKLSVYGIMSSTGKTGLDWDERSKYGNGDNGFEYDEDNGFFFGFWNNDEFENSSYYGEGLPKSWSAGLNYSNKFNDDKQSLNGSYRFTKINTEGAGSNLMQLITGNNIFTTRDSGNTFSSRQRQSANGTFEWNFDSSTSLKIKASGYLGKTNSLSINNSSALNEMNVLTNSSFRKTTAKGDNGNITASILFRKKFKKVGRSFSWNTEQRFDEINTTGYLFALIDTLTASGNLNSTITDQQKQNNSRTNSINSKISYTEPLAKRVFLELNYAIRNTANNSERLTYNKDLDGKYEFLNDTFSNHYRFNVFTNTTGLSLKYNGKKLVIGGGSNIAFTNFKQTDLFTNIVDKRDFINFFPKANISYKIGQGTRFGINYNGSTQQPTISQIQPVQDNSNPLVITIGNPALKQQFNHSINMNFNSFQMLSQRSFYMWGNATFQHNAIVTRSFISDTSGKTTMQYINANGNYNYYMGGGYYMKLKKLDANLNFSLNINGSRFYSFVNDIKNTTINNAPGFDMGIGKDKEKKYNIYFRYGFNYNFSKTIVNSTVKTNYWTMNPSISITYQLPKKLEVNTNVDMNLRQRTDLFTQNNNVILWDAYIGRKIFKNDKGIIKFVAHDILDQNIGYNRYVSGNQISESNYQTIRRYFMLSFVWNFTKKLAAPEANAAGGDTIITK